MITVEGLRAEVRREMKLSVGLRCQMSKFLEDKSKGNLTEDEQKLLDTALYEARSRFIGVASQYINF